MKTLVSLAGLAFATLASAQSPTLLSGEQKINATEGSFGGALDESDRFGRSVANIGDLDGDSVEDLAVGAALDDDGGFNRGAVWILFMNTDGTVKSQQKISQTEGSFGGALDDSDQFGSSVIALEDLDSDGVRDMAVGASLDDDGGLNRGAVWILFMNTDGTVKGEQKISATVGGFGGLLEEGDRFGHTVACPGDLDGDGRCELFVGADQDDDGGPDRGAVWLLYLDLDGTVRTEQKISSTMGGFFGELEDGDRFGSALAVLDDFDLDGVPELAVGAHDSDLNGPDRGAIWVLFLESTGMVKSAIQIGSTTCLPILPVLEDFDRFGSSIAALGDLDGDGGTDLAVGAPGDDSFGSNTGTVWMIFLDEDAAVRCSRKITASEGGFVGTLTPQDRFGIGVAALDFDDDGLLDVAIGADEDGDAGAVWTAFGTGCVPALVTERNGNDVNPIGLEATTGPVFGKDWILTLDCSNHEPSVAGYFGRSVGLETPIDSFAGEILIDFASQRVFQLTFMHGGTLNQIVVQVPVDTSLCGFRIYSQAACLGAPGAQLTNAIDFIVGV